MKKYCEKCRYYENRYYGGHTYVIGCKYNLNEEPYDTFLKRKYESRNPIPSIHNAYNDCKYYKEDWLTKLLRRIKNDTDGKN